MLQVLQQTLDSGKDLSFPDGLIINGGQPTAFNGDQGTLCFDVEDSSSFLTRSSFQFQEILHVYSGKIIFSWSRPFDSYLTVLLQLLY